MSMLSNQADELRGYALSVRNVAFRETSLCYEARRDLFDSSLRMEQAADTITSLSDKLQGVMGTRYNELFGTPERAAVTLVRISDERAVCKLPTWTASSNDYEAWLEWLGGESDG